MPCIRLRLVLVSLLCNHSRSLIKGVHALDVKAKSRGINVQSIYCSVKREVIDHFRKVQSYDKITWFVVDVKEGKKIPVKTHPWKKIYGKSTN